MPDKELAHPEVEALTVNLSIATFRYVPPGLDLTGEGREDYLRGLNTALLERLQDGGRAYLSNAMVDGQFALRACIVNFRTTRTDVEALPELVAELGRELVVEPGWDPCGEQG